MLIRTCLVLGLLATVAPFIAGAAEVTTVPPTTTQKAIPITTQKALPVTTQNALPNTTQKIQANIVEGIDSLISKVAASYKSVNSGFIRIPDIKNFMAPDFQEGIFGDLSRLQRVSLSLVRESPAQENPKTVSFQVTLPEAIARYNKIKIGFGFLIPTRQLSCIVKDLVYDAELSIDYINNGCLANLSKFQVSKKGVSKCKLTGGYIRLIDEFLSGFVNAWNHKLVNEVKNNISKAIQSHLNPDFDCNKYRTMT